MKAWLDINISNGYIMFTLIKVKNKVVDLVGSTGAMGHTFLRKIVLLNIACTSSLSVIIIYM